MIEQAAFGNVAAFHNGATQLQDLRTINFIYGPNGSGKTSLSRGFEGTSPGVVSNLDWRSGASLQVQVYNRDYVDRAFYQDSALPGIFTLGEDAAAAKIEIERLKAEIGKVQKIIGRDKSSIGHAGGDKTAPSGRLGELGQIRVSFNKACWTEMRRFPTELAPIFKGYGDSMKRLSSRVLELSPIATTGSNIDINALRAKALTAFDETVGEAKALTLPNGAKLVEIAERPVLAAKIVGKADVDISALILALGNSDWVSQGRDYFPSGADRCPFCQQPVQHDLAAKLEQFFDKSYSTQIQEVSNLLHEYEACWASILDWAGQLQQDNSAFLDAKAFQVGLATLEVAIATNLELLRSKVATPSTPIALSEVDEHLANVIAVVESANSAIGAHNEDVRNRAALKQSIVREGWSYFIQVTLAAQLATFVGESKGPMAALASLERRVAKGEGIRHELERKLRELEGTVTSSKPTILAINSLLQQCGFTNFALSEAEDVPGGYRLTRGDLSPAVDTLSEGERTFISFLYFFQQLESVSSGARCIAVIDDPISSLDSEALFVVSGLIRGLIAGIRKNKSSVAQLVLLTHNVYFHKEVAYLNPRAESPKDVAHYVVRKSANGSAVVRHDKNPIKTSYSLLWAEVARARDGVGTPIGLQNVMRRIYESYFRVTGGWSDDDILDKFAGAEKVICRSLLSWVNDGSHSVLDDISVSIDSINIESYLRVFEAVFERTGHGAHFRMMMPAEGIIS